MIIVDCIQGTPEWHEARAGVVTASMFTIARSITGGLTEQQKIYVDAIKSGDDKKTAQEKAKYKTAPRASGIDAALNGEQVGEFSETAKNYAFRVAIERISKTALDEGFETWSMRRGRELEEDCRKRHSLDLGFYVEECGFIKTDDSKFGCSVDCLVDDDGGGEYKCFVSPEKLRDIILNDDISTVKDQIQGSLWLTGRKWWDFCLYCPALALVGKDYIRKRVYRDEEYIFELERDLVAFEKLVTENEITLRA